MLVARFETAIVDYKAQLKRAEQIEADRDALKKEQIDTHATITSLKHDNGELTSKLSFRVNEVTELQDELEQQRAKLHGDLDMLRQEHATAAAVAANDIGELKATAAALAEKLEALLKKYSDRKVRFRREKAELTELVASLEEKMAFAASAKQQAEADSRRLTRELSEMQRKVEQFRSSVQNEGLMQAAGVQQVYCVWLRNLASPSLTVLLTRGLTIA